MAELSFKKSLPLFAEEIRRGLSDEGRVDLLSQIEVLKIVDRCRCGEENCATFYTARKPEDAYGSGHSTLLLGSVQGLVVIDLVDKEIKCIEVLDRPDVKAALDGVI